MRKLALFIAMSLDGNIAKPGDDLEFLKLVEQEGEDYGHAEFLAGVDAIILGRRTYAHVLKHIDAAYYDDGERDVYVVTRTARPEQGRTTFYTGQPHELVAQLKKEQGKTIYCDGGAEVIDALLHHDAVDEMIISVIPVLVGGGTRLFKDGRPEQRLALVGARTFGTGLVQLHYRRP